MRETEKKKNTNLSFDEVEILPLTQFDPYKLGWFLELSHIGLRICQTEEVGLG